MPGIVVFKRRWSVGSDDLVVPAVFFVILHIVWVVVLAVTLGVVEFDPMIECAVHLREHVLGYLVILSGCVLLEASIAGLAMRGTILETGPRTGMQYLLYVRLGILVVEVVWLVIGVIWVSQHYSSCTAIMAKRAILGIIVCNWLILLSVLMSLWCTFDTAGRSWVKMKRYQESLKEREGRPGHKRRSGSRRRNWRQRKAHSTLSVERVTRKAMRAYEESWDRRCGTLFCCVKEDRHRSSFTEVAKLFTEFFRDLDVVPSDIVAGLVLLRKHQKLRRKCVVAQGTNEVYQFLSGVPITPTTRFLSLKSSSALADYNKVVRYMRYALGAYGWPMYMMMNTGTGLCKIMPHLRCCRCCCCCCMGETVNSMVTDDCCQCNFAAMKKLSGLKALDVIYCSYHVDIGETPFFVALDHAEKKVVISIRGTLSLQDVLTDLKADAEILPVEPLKEDWLGHKGMVQAAVYIKKKIKDEMLLSRAFSKDPDMGTPSYELVLVGHSLGAGTAAILAILLHAEHPNLHCYAYSPPGGLISATCVEETKHFITSVVVGKDVVARIGLHQLEAMRQDLINVIKQSNDPKWKIITGSMMCCCRGREHDDMTSENEQTYLQAYDQMKREKESRYFTHPSDDQISLTTHTPLFLPGKIIHVVRNHPKESSRLCGQEEPVYQAVLAENMDFDEVLISPTMINDHMPDKVLEALEKVLTKVSPAKPSRKYSEAERRAMLSDAESGYEPTDLPQEPLIENCAQDWVDGVEEEVEVEEVIEANEVAPALRSPPPDTNARHVKALSYPAPSCMRPTRLDILARDEWNGHAPLATPETLSETSSLESVSSQGSSRKFGKLSYQKLTSTVPRLQPIQQSPLRHTRSDGYCYFLSQPSPVEYPDSPQKDFGILSKSNVKPATSDETLPSVETQYPNSSVTDTSPTKRIPAQLMFVNETEEGYVKHSPDSPESGSQLIPEYNPGDLGYHMGGCGYPGYLPGIIELSPEESPGTEDGLAECSFLDSAHQDTDNLLSSMEELPTDTQEQTSKPSPGEASKDTDFLLDNGEERDNFEDCIVAEKAQRTRSVPKEYLDKDILSQDSTDQDYSSQNRSHAETDNLLSPEMQFKADLQQEFLESQMIESESMQPNAQESVDEFTAEDPHETQLLDTLENHSQDLLCHSPLRIVEECSEPTDEGENLNESFVQSEGSEGSPNVPQEQSDLYEMNLLNTLETDENHDVDNGHEMYGMFDHCHEEVKHSDSKGYQADIEDNSVPLLETCPYVDNLAQNTLSKMAGDKTDEDLFERPSETVLLAQDPFSILPAMDTDSSHNTKGVEQVDEFSQPQQLDEWEEPVLSKGHIDIKNYQSIPEQDTRELELPGCQQKEYSDQNDCYETDLLSSLEPTESQNNFRDSFNDSFEDRLHFDPPSEDTPLVQKQYSDSPKNRNGVYSTGNAPNSSSSSSEGINVHSSRPCSEYSPLQTDVSKEIPDTGVFSDILEPTTTTTADCEALPANHNVLLSNSLHDQEHNDLLTAALKHDLDLNVQFPETNSETNSENANQNCSGNSRGSLSPGEQFLQDLVAVSGAPLQESEV